MKVKLKTYKLLDGREEELIGQVGDGSIIKRFDRTSLPENDNDVVCPHFLELKWGTGCPFNCSWCYLQGTLRFPPRYKKPYVKDYDKIGRHLEALFGDSIGVPELLNTGELADSLMNEDGDNPFSTFIIPLFEKQKRYKVLFLTKSTSIDNLLRLKDHNQVIVSYSLNSFKIAKEWEKGAPPVADRIESAKRLSEEGYTVRIRIDPLVPVIWQEKEWGYRELIYRIFEAFIPERITLGSLRGLQSTINMARDKSWVGYLSERTNWGKRVVSHIRGDVYSEIINYLEEEYDYTSIALCKETIGIWDELRLDYKKIRCNCVL